ncbi:MAG: hypothetical protein ACRD4R_17010 [Candidatus Acidiferrales bacterium]
MFLLDVEPLDLGSDVRSVGVDLVEADQNREPVRGIEASRVWTRIFPALAGDQKWVLDFFSHLDRIRDFCQRHNIAFREASQRSVVIPAPEPKDLESLIDRFQNETFGVRAGGALPDTDAELEGELARHGLDAYHAAFHRYYFCAVCNFEDGSLVLLSERLSAGEVIRRARPLIGELEIKIELPN